MAKDQKIVRRGASAPKSRTSKKDVQKGIEVASNFETLDTQIDEDINQGILKPSGSVYDDGELIHESYDMTDVEVDDYGRFRHITETGKEVKIKLHDDADPNAAALDIYRQEALASRSGTTDSGFEWSIEIGDVRYVAKE